MDRQPISQQGSIFFSLALSNDQLANQPLTNQQMDRQPICQQGSIFFSLAYLVTNPLTNSQLQALVYDSLPPTTVTPDYARGLKKEQQQKQHVS